VHRQPDPASLDEHSAGDQPRQVLSGAVRPLARFAPSAEDIGTEELGIEYDRECAGRYQSDDRKENVEHGAEHRERVREGDLFSIAFLERPLIDRLRLLRMKA
jgi:hypothetical protein